MTEAVIYFQWHERLTRNQPRCSLDIKSKHSDSRIFKRGKQARQSFSLVTRRVSYLPGSSPALHRKMGLHGEMPIFVKRVQELWIPPCLLTSFCSMLKWQLLLLLSRFPHSSDLLLAYNAWPGPLVCLPQPVVGWFLDPVKVKPGCMCTRWRRPSGGRG